ncbi:hypothetical protein IB276_17855 [Ensifer sp. ENS04]|uniref:hypothetical protein n=1 Tax=Ensifer sp. ENS04 TaxID=2769281 RepID=UPI00177F1D95|nr:hypothetical protein [Ensifer sp. ENS04]MBD9541323.1 hypothetical protein [Ensifer sp. ENS04]
MKLRKHCYEKNDLRYIVGVAEMRANCLRIPSLLVSITATALVCPGVATANSCWSLLDSKFGADIKAAVTNADPCKKMKGGIDVTEKFQINVLDLCTAPQGVKVIVAGNMTCRTGDAAMIKASASGSLEADMTVDVGACKITHSEVKIGGAIGKFVSSMSNFQDAARGFAQAKLTDMCGVSK